MGGVKRVATAGVILPTALYCVSAPPAFVVFVGALSALASWEFCGLVLPALVSQVKLDPWASQRGNSLIILLVLLNWVQIGAAFLWGGQGLGSAFLFAVLVVAIVVLLVRPLRGTPVDLYLLIECGVCMCGLVYCGLTLAHCILVRSHGHEPSHGHFWMLALIIGSFQGDNGALWAGSLFGRTQLCRTISPAKTLEGAVGSLCLASASMFGFGWWVAVYNHNHTPCPAVTSLYTWGGYGLMCGLFGMIGDLIESTIKRASSASDSGRLLPGHGGVLDLVDCLLVTAPLTYHAAMPLVYHMT